MPICASCREIRCGHQPRRKQVSDSVSKSSHFWSHKRPDTPVWRQTRPSTGAIHRFGTKRVFTGWVGARMKGTRLRGVAPRPRVPRDLTHRPFTLQEARAAGISPTSLKGKSWHRIGAELYSWTGLHEDPWRLLVAWQRLLPADAAFAGMTAAWLLGLGFDPTQPVEIVVSPTSGLRSRAGLTVRRCNISPSDVVQVRGLRAPSVHRTLCNLRLRLPAVETLVALDAAIRAGLTDRTSLVAHRRLQSLAILAAPAESPMETRLRWLLVQSG